MSILFGGDKGRPQLSATCRTGACVGECVSVYTVGVFVCMKSSQSRKKWLPRPKSIKGKCSSLSVIETCDQSKWKREGKPSPKHLEPLEYGLEGGVYKTLLMPS